MKDKKNSCVIELLICFVIAFIGVTLCSKTSFIYTINEWDDDNTIFAVGRGLFSGRVMYRDLYEQKGPYIYVLYGIASLISHTSFIGVYIFELIAMTAAFFFAWKICRRYLAGNSLLAVLVFSITVFYSQMWVDGGSVEEFTLPMFLLSLYCFTSAVDEKRDFSMKVLLMNGILAGIVLWSKYSMLGFYGFFMISVIIYDLIEKKKKVITQCLVFLSGMLITTVPLLIYFAVNNALDVFAGIYLTGNINNYSLNKGGIISRFPGIIKAMLSCTCFSRPNQYNMLYMIFLVLSLCVILFSKRIRISEKLFLLMMSAFTFLGIFYGGLEYYYYPLATMAFVLPGIILLIEVFNLICRNKLLHRLIPAAYLVFAAAIVLTLFFRVYEVKKTGPKDELAQYRFAKIINEVPDATILDYGCTDTGFFMACDYIPDFRFFSYFNHASDPTAYDTQDSYVRDGKSMFVITDKISYDWGSYPETDMSEMTKYELVDECVQTIHFRTDSYKLYRLKDEYMDGAVRSKN